MATFGRIAAVHEAKSKYLSNVTLGRLVPAFVCNDTISLTIRNMHRESFVLSTLNISKPLRFRAIDSEGHIPKYTVRGFEVTTSAVNAHPATIAINTPTGINRVNSMLFI